MCSKSGVFNNWIVLKREEFFFLRPHFCYLVTTNLSQVIVWHSEKKFHFRPWYGWFSVMLSTSYQFGAIQGNICIKTEFSSVWSSCSPAKWSILSSDSRKSIWLKRKFGITVSLTGLVTDSFSDHPEPFAYRSVAPWCFVRRMWLML